MGKGKGAKFGLALAAGAAAGYLASLFISEKTKKEHKQQVTEAVDKLASKLMSEKDKKRASQLFKQATKQGEKHLTKAKKILARNLVAANKTFTSIDKQKYLDSVNKTISTLKKKGELNQKQLKKIQTFLEEDYNLFKTNKQAVQTKNE